METSSFSHPDAAPQDWGHRPVLVQEAVQLLGARAGGAYLDGTVGAGGHAEAILEASAPDGQLLGLDLDPQALERARARLARFGTRVRLVRANFRDLDEVARAEGFMNVDGVLLDLGLCSLQLASGRGFSFQEEAPLDMRFDPEAPLTAAEIVNRAPEGELVRILREWGEEPRARAIARRIVAARPLRTARELAAVGLRAVGQRGSRTHPATRTFQALRIATNRELENLQRALAAALRLLRPGGRLVVISYHSLEDRIVKQFIQREERDCICPPEVPECHCGHGASLRSLTRRPVRPGADELRANPRARSARLRAAERLSGTAQGA
jgi:16S rRNA (cytosine1402-N4)-methyltransferase